MVFELPPTCCSRTLIALLDDSSNHCFSDKLFGLLASDHYWLFTASNVLKTIVLPVLHHWVMSDCGDYIERPLCWIALGALGCLRDLRCSMRHSGHRSRYLWERLVYIRMVKGSGEASVVSLILAGLASLVWPGKMSNSFSKGCLWLLWKTLTEQSMILENPLSWLIILI